MSADVVQMADRCAVFVCTITPFRRPANPKRCNIKRYHVWRWRGGPKAPPGTLCQCGLLDDPPMVPDAPASHPAREREGGGGG